MEHLSKLIGKTITGINFSTGTYIPINDTEISSLEINEVIVNIEDYSITISNRNNLNTENIISFVGDKIKQVNETKEELRITTEDNNYIIIHLKNEDYFGPEAMCLYGPNNLIIVWN